MSTRVDLEPGCILHRRPYSNTSYILELFTRQHGRIAALARSARGLKSRYRGKLELFFPMLLSWVGQRELKTLGNVDFFAAPIYLEGRALLCGFYLNELLMKLLPRADPYPKLFDCYQATLYQLLQGSCVESVLRCFEKNMLNELGYGLPLGNELQTGAPITEADKYQYIPERGFLLREQTAAQQDIFSGASLLALHREQFANKQQLSEVKRLMRLVLSRHLGHKEIHSRALLL